MYRTVKGQMLSASKIHCLIQKIQIKTTFLLAIEKALKEEANWEIMLLYKELA